MRLTAVCVVVAAALAATTDAHGCSCAIVDAREALTRFDGAFIGTLVERKDESQEGATLVFKVEERFKGALGSTVEVRTPSNSAACGIEAPNGSRMGLFLERDGGRWVGTLCSQVEPARLREAARPLPAPNGKGPVALLVGGRFGTARTLALDRLGRTIAYGQGPGSVIGISACPGGRRMVEVAQTDGGLVLAARDVRTLRQLRRQTLGASATVPSALRCANASATEVFLFFSSQDAPQDARLSRVTPASISVIWKGTALAATLTHRLAYVNAGRRANRLLAVDLHARTVRNLGRLPAFTGPLVPDDRGIRLAGISMNQRTSQPSSVVLVVVGSRPARFRTTTLGAPQVNGDVFWLGSRLAFLPQYGMVDARVYDAGLRVVSRFSGWRAQKAALVGSTAFGVGFGDGRLLRAKLPSGPVRVARQLPSPVTYVIASVG